MTGLKIAHLFPEALNTGGDRGNVLCLKQRLVWRDLACEVQMLSPEDAPQLTGFDLLYIGGGQEFDRSTVMERLRTGWDKEILAAIADDVVVLATGGGYQLMGQYFETLQGDRFAFLGAAAFHTIEGKDRLIGNYAFQAGEESGGSEVVGFENHSGRTYLGNQAIKGTATGNSIAKTQIASGSEACGQTKPLGTVLSGFGNNGEDGTEGVRHRNLFGCYAHGPLLPKNPQFCDHLLATALFRKTGKGDLAPLDDAYETLAHDTVLAKTLDGSLGKEA